jgi:hypothetical protein
MVGGTCETGASFSREAREKLKFARFFPIAREIIARTPRFPSPQSPSPSWPNACKPGSTSSKLLNDIDALMYFSFTDHWSLVTGHCFHGTGVAQRLRHNPTSSEHGFSRRADSIGPRCPAGSAEEPGRSPRKKARRAGRSERSRRCGSGPHRILRRYSPVQEAGHQDRRRGRESGSS